MNRNFVLYVITVLAENRDSVRKLQQRVEVESHGVEEPSHSRAVGEDVNPVMAVVNSLLDNFVPTSFVQMFDAATGADESSFESVEDFGGDISDEESSFIEVGEGEQGEGQPEGGDVSGAQSHSVVSSQSEDTVPHVEVESVRQDEPEAHSSGREVPAIPPPPYVSPEHQEHEQIAKEITDEIKQRVDLKVDELHREAGELADHVKGEIVKKLDDEQAKHDAEVTQATQRVADSAQDQATKEVRPREPPPPYQSPPPFDHPDQGSPPTGSQQQSSPAVQPRQQSSEIPAKALVPGGPLPDRPPPPDSAVVKPTPGRDQSPDADELAAREKDRQAEATARQAEQEHAREEQLEASARAQEQSQEEDRREEAFRTGEEPQVQGPTQNHCRNPSGVSDACDGESESLLSQLTGGESTDEKTGLQRITSEDVPQTQLVVASVAVVDYQDASKHPPENIVRVEEDGSKLQVPDLFVWSVTNMFAPLFRSTIEAEGPGAWMSVYRPFQVYMQQEFLRDPGSAAEFARWMIAQLNLDNKFEFIDLPLDGDEATALASAESLYGYLRQTQQAEQDRKYAEQRDRSSALELGAGKITGPTIMGAVAEIIKKDGSGAQQVSIDIESVIQQSPPLLLEDQQLAITDGSKQPRDVLADMTAGDLVKSPNSAVWDQSESKEFSVLTEYPYFYTSSGNQDAPIVIQPQEMMSLGLLKLKDEATWEEADMADVASKMKELVNAEQRKKQEDWNFSPGAIVTFFWPTFFTNPLTQKWRDKFTAARNEQICGIVLRQEEHPDTNIFPLVTVDFGSDFGDADDDGIVTLPPDFFQVVPGKISDYKLVPHDKSEPDETTYNDEYLKMFGFPQVFDFGSNEMKALTLEKAGQDEEARLKDMDGKFFPFEKALKSADGTMVLIAPRIPEQPALEGQPEMLQIEDGTRIPEQPAIEGQPEMLQIEDGTASSTLEMKDEFDCETRQDCYAALGMPTPEDRTLDDTAEVKKTYRKIAIRDHPDKNPDNPEAKDRFIRADRAYHKLTDAEQRAKLPDKGDVVQPAASQVDSPASQVNSPASQVDSPARQWRVAKIISKSGDESSLSEAEIVLQFVHLPMATPETMTFKMSDWNPRPDETVEYAPQHLIHYDQEQLTDQRFKMLFNPSLLIDAAVPDQRVIVHKAIEVNNQIVLHVGDKATVLPQHGKEKHTIKVFIDGAFAEVDVLNNQIYLLLSGHDPLIVQMRAEAQRLAQMDDKQLALEEAKTIQPDEGNEGIDPHYTNPTKPLAIEGPQSDTTVANGAIVPYQKEGSQSDTTVVPGGKGSEQEGAIVPYQQDGSQSDTTLPDGTIVPYQPQPIEGSGSPVVANSGFSVGTESQTQLSPPTVGDESGRTELPSEGIQDGSQVQPLPGSGGPPAVSNGGSEQVGGTSDVRSPETIARDDGTVVPVDRPATTVPEARDDTGERTGDSGAVGSDVVPQQQPPTVVPDSGGPQDISGVVSPSTVSGEDGTRAPLSDDRPPTTVPERRPEGTGEPVVQGTSGPDSSIVPQPGSELRPAESGGTDTRREGGSSEVVHGADEQSGDMTGGGSSGRPTLESGGVAGESEVVTMEQEELADDNKIIEEVMVSEGEDHKQKEEQRRRDLIEQKRELIRSAGETRDLTPEERAEVETVVESDVASHKQEQQKHDEELKEKIGELREKHKGELEAAASAGGETEEQRKAKLQTLKQRQEEETRQKVKEVIAGWKADEKAKEEAAQELRDVAAREDADAKKLADQQKEQETQALRKKHQKEIAKVEKRFPPKPVKGNSRARQKAQQDNLTRETQLNAIKERQARELAQLQQQQEQPGQEVTPGPQLTPPKDIPGGPPDQQGQPLGPPLPGQLQPGQVGPPPPQVDQQQQQAQGVDVDPDVQRQLEQEQQEQQLAQLEADQAQQQIQQEQQADQTMTQPQIVEEQRQPEQVQPVTTTTQELPTGDQPLTVAAKPGDPHAPQRDHLVGQRRVDQTHQETEGRHTSADTTAKGKPKQNVQPADKGPNPYLH